MNDKNHGMGRKLTDYGDAEFSNSVVVQHVVRQCGVSAASTRLTQPLDAGKASLGPTHHALHLLRYWNSVVYRIVVT